MDGDTGTGTMIGPLQLVVIGFPRAEAVEQAAAAEAARALRDAGQTEEAAAPEAVQTLVAAPPFATKRWREVHDH
jgi:hypothetical protein